MSKAEHRIAFSGLNELRAVAALAVVFHHLELFKQREGMSSLYGLQRANTFISNLGHNGVLCFFVLSGFLITYLLLAEKREFSTIAVKAFYIRRILRIWPLYFLIVFIGFVLMPWLGSLPFFANQKFYPGLIAQLDYNTLILFVLFLSNFALVFMKPVAGASQSWSVSVEEQFYLLWPWLVKKSKGIKGLFTIVAGIFIIKVLVEQLVIVFFPQLTWLSGMLSYFQIEYMCVGAMGAMLLFNGKLDQVKPMLVNPFTIMGMGILLLLELGVYNHSLVLAVLFFYFIYVLISTAFSSKPLHWLGQISYGIYMYHPLVIFIMFSVCAQYFPSVLAFNAAFYILTLAGTILLSYVSYHYYERYFLKFKSRYTLVSSGG